MRRPYFVALLPILFAGLTLGCADTKTSAPTKSPTAKPGIAKPVPGGDAAAKNAVSPQQPKTSAKENEAAKSEQVKDMAAAKDVPAKAESKAPDTKEKASEPAPAPKAAAKVTISPEEAKHVASIDVLGEKGEATPEVFAKLSEGLKSNSALVRAHAAHALGALGSAAKPAAPQLVALVTDPDQTVRREVVRAMAKIRPGPDVSIPLLTKALDDADPAVRLNALATIAELGKPVVPFLIRLLKDESAGKYACLALADLGPDAAEAVPALIEKLKAEKLPVFRRDVIFALGQIGPAAGPAAPALVEALDDPSTAVRLTAAYALGLIGPQAKAAVPGLEKQSDAPDAVLKIVSAWALVKIKPDDAKLKDKVIALLGDAAGSKEPLARAAAMRALVDLHPSPEKILPALRPHLLSADKEVAAEALRTLTGLGQASVPALVEALTVLEHRPVVAAVLASMGEGAKEAVPALIEIVKTDKSPESRKEALMALGAIGPAAKEAVPAAIAALGDRNEKVNYAACFALGRIGPAAIAAEPELKKKLTSADPLFPSAAAWAIVKIDPKTPDAPQLVPQLMKALDYHEPLIRAGTARTLGHLGPVAKEALPALRKLLDDKDENVKKAAAEAIKAIAG
ncbi:MAG: HEAT repeat domain-containing protein [Thermoguttaceae bacterium]